MKKLVLFISASIIGSLAISQNCLHTLPSTVIVKKSDGQHVGDGDALWICENRAIEIKGTTTTAYIEKNCDIWITGNNQTNIYMKAPGSLLIDGDNGKFTVDSGVVVTDNGSGNTVSICNSSTQAMKYDYKNISGVTGCIDTSKVGVESVTKVEPVTMYPNPVTSILNVSFGKNYSATDYKIYSMSGQVILSGIISSNPVQIDLSSTNKGLYFIEFNTNKGKFSKRISVE